MIATATIVLFGAWLIGAWLIGALVQPEPSN
jgi:hypothetical protein